MFDSDWQPLRPVPNNLSEPPSDTQTCALSKDEFRNGWAGTRNALAAQRLKAEFQRHDANKDGKLQANEYANLALVQRAGKSAPMMSAFDKNKDQGLDFAEYVDFVKTAAQQHPAAPAAAKSK